MNIYGISFVDGETITVEADYFTVENGMVQLFTFPDFVGEYPTPSSAYNISSVMHICQQKRYTEEEVLRDIINSK